MLDIDQIKELIPHRYPFLLVDRIIEVEKGRRAVGIKNITGDDYYCQQKYFNEESMIPGSLQVEMMAQVSAFVVMETVDDQKTIPLFACIEKARFRKAVQPGDQLRIEVDLLKSKANAFKFKARVFIEGVLASEANITCMLVSV